MELPALPPFYCLRRDVVSGLRRDARGGKGFAPAKEISVKIGELSIANGPTQKSKHLPFVDPSSLK